MEIQKQASQNVLEIPVFHTNTWPWEIKDSEERIPPLRNAVSGCFPPIRKLQDDFRPFQVWNFWIHSNWRSWWVLHLFFWDQSGFFGCVYGFCDLTMWCHLSQLMKILEWGVDVINGRHFPHFLPEGLLCSLLFVSKSVLSNSLQLIFHSSPLCPSSAWRGCGRWVCMDFHGCCEPDGLYWVISFSLVLLFLVSPLDHGLGSILVPEGGFTDVFSPLKNLCLY